MPVCFATDGGTIYSALDAKPKRVAPTDLRRVRNLLAQPEVALLVDDYAEEWGRLSYLLVHGTAALIAPGQPEHERAIVPAYARNTRSTRRCRSRRSR